jgi:hypothetical protein
MKTCDWSDAHLSLNFAMPKSQTFARPRLSRRTLDDFRSLHQTNIDQ